MGYISYEKLKKMMEDKGLTSYRIRKEKIISENTLQSIRNNKSVSMTSIAALCKVLECQPGDILEYIDTDQAKE